MILLRPGDTSVQFQMVRMRLNDADDKQFRSYTSGGIYVDFQQSARRCSSGSFMDSLSGLGSSLFAALASPAKPASSSASKSAAGSAASKGNNFFQAAKTPPRRRPARLCPLQAASHRKFITLPGGSGKHSFACFAKG